MRAKSRSNPTKPAITGLPVRREFEYQRHGIAVLFAALDVHDGQVAGWLADSTRSENFVEFPADLVAQDGVDLPCIVDNLKTHSIDLVEAFLGRHPRVHLRFTPTHASWLNQVELFFSILGRRLLRRGTSTRSITWPNGSSPSSRNTTVGPHPSIGPTTAGP
jgi:transposase